jgi:2-keto-3-deoxy-6-phosphogluconate aldolase
MTHIEIRSGALCQAAGAVRAIGPHATLSTIEAAVQQIMDEFDSVDTAIHAEVFEVIYEGVTALKTAPEKVTPGAPMAPHEQLVLVF